MIRRNKKYTYNPNKAPKAKEWLRFDEGKRLQLVIAYHEKEGNYGESIQAHAAMHVSVENQCAMGAPHPTKAAIKRLMLEGADRHEAIHAISSVLAGKMWEAFNTDLYPDGESMNRAFENEVSNLTLQKWYDEYAE